MVFELEELVEVDVDVDEVDVDVLDVVELALVLELELEDVVVAELDEEVVVVDEVVAVESELAEVLDVSVDVDAVVVSRATTCLSSKSASVAWGVELLHRSTTQIISVCASFVVHPACSRHCCSDVDLEP